MDRNGALAPGANKLEMSHFGGSPASYSVVGNLIED